MTDTDRPKRSYTRIRLSPDDEAEMLRRYTKTDMPVGDIGTDFDVHTTYIYRLLDRHGIGWRRDHGSTYSAWARMIDQDTEAQAEDQAIAAITLEEDARVHRQAMVADELRDLKATVDRVVDMETDITRSGLHWWTVELRETLAVPADSIDGALFAAREHRPGARITAIIERTPDVAS